MQMICSGKGRQKTMRLYHTGDKKIRAPDIHIGRKNADFGQGFYLSPDRDFACRLAGKNGIINTYEMDLTVLKVLHFTRNADWFDCICQNRRGHDTCDADVVIGPIANDTIFDTMGIISSGFLKPEVALKLLLIGPEYIQAAVKSEKAASQLTWISSGSILRLEEEARRKEQEAYQELFAKTMEQLTDA